jgi:saccharopine dehydrogenase-like NADP-dependent oxidoreductase
MYTLHSEVATLPISFAAKGVREVSFKIAFDPYFLSQVRFLRDLGLASHEPIEISGVKVKPIEFINKIAMSQKPGKQIGKLKQYEIVRAVVKGIKNKKKTTITLDCHTSGMPKWGIGTDLNTGSPPSIAALMLGRGEIRGTGVRAPENSIDPLPFFAALKKRRFLVKASIKTGW